MWPLATLRAVKARSYLCRCVQLRARLVRLRVAGKATLALPALR